MKNRLCLMASVIFSAWAYLAPTVCFGQDPAEAADETTSLEEIVVIGKYRRSLQDALSEKRYASEIIEALSAEDIGALPDTSVAESLARLPGLSYTRNAFGANNVSIRGLGAVLTNGTLNGRDLASEWGDRSVSFSLFPAELISRASVYKAPSASHVEGGIGGTVDLRTARPLDWDERSMTMNFRGRYNDMADDLPDGESIGYRGSVTYVDQFADETLGVALGYAGQYSPLVSADSYIHESRTVAYGGAIEGIPEGSGPEQEFNIPYGAEDGILNGTSERHSILGVIQWKPLENAEVSFDGFFSTFEQSATAVGLGLGEVGFGNVFSDVTTDGFNLTGATVACARPVTNDCLDRGFGLSLSTQNSIDDGDSELQSYGLEGKWRVGDALSLTYDFSWSKADGGNAYTTVRHRPYAGEPGSPELVRPVATFGENESGAAFLTSPLDFADVSTNRTDALRLIEGEREDEIYIYALDAEYNLNSVFFSAFKLGFRFVNRDNILIRSEARAYPSASASATLDPAWVMDTFDQSRVSSAFVSNPILVVDARSIRDTVFAGVDAVVLPSSSHFIEEDVRAYYAQVDFDMDSFLGIPASGNFGVRVVTTDVDTEGTSSVEGMEAPIVTSDKYTEALPSANINFFPTDNLVVRLAGARVLARPAINFLSPGTDRYGDRIFGGAEGGGNPFLKPFIANQADLSVERYFGEDSALALAFFYKDMDTFITQSRIQSPPPDNTVSFVPANGSGGRIYGLEATLQHTFSGLLPQHYGDIGIYATYTYTDSNVKLTETFNSGVFDLDGQSDHVGNITVHYHRHKLAARASYRYRSEFTRPQRPARAFTTNRGEGDLSFQVSYDFNEQIRFFVEGYGLLDEPRDSFYGLESLQGAYSVYGRNIQFGASYRF